MGHYIIKAEEIRRGNLVDTFLGVKPIEEILKDNYVTVLTEVGHFKLIIEELEPIPLTPEILEKCGFKKGENQSGGSEWKEYEAYYSRYMILVIVNEYFHEWIEIEDGFFSYYKSLEIKYLHQLQNIIFVNTGEELNIQNLISTDKVHSAP